MITQRETISDAEKLLVEFVERGNLCTCNDMKQCLTCRAYALLVRSGIEPQIKYAVVQSDDL